MVHGSLLSICSVSYNSRPWLEINLDLAHRLNRHIDLIWLVAENSPVGSPLQVGSDSERFQVMPGAAFEQRPYASGSYHHGRAMNLILPHVTTRFALFCDPDFFIVKMGWVQEVIGHMLLRGVGVFGVPWHPRWVHKNRYFPCVHCMFVDLHRVPVAWLDFRPDYKTVPAHARHPVAADRSSHLRWLGQIKLPDPLKFRKRRHIGQSRDVSWRIAQRVAAEPSVRVECLQPVFRPSGRGLVHQVERLLPDRLCLVPKRPDYFTEQRFKDHGLPDLDSRGWEEFQWRGEPFGFHVRSQPKLKGKQSLATHLTEVAEILRCLPGVG